MEGRLYLLAVALMALILMANTAGVAASGQDVAASGDECNQTEYRAYRECVHDRRKRQSIVASSSAATAAANETKVFESATVTVDVVTPSVVVPSADYVVSNSTAAQKADASLLSHCERLHFDCLIGCEKANDTTNCEGACPVCPVNADRVAHDYQTVVLESVDGKTEQFQARIEAGRNVTTIIRLTNYITNNNTIHIPTNVTTTNLNNVHLHTLGRNATTKSDAANGVDFGLGVTDQGSCCVVVRPKTCAATSAGPKCQHRRHKTCDNHVCTAKIVHAQSRRRCNRRGECHNKIVYVPEPGPQKCVHIDQWPHVVCGTEVADRKRNCDGCYDHYGYGFENYNNGGGGRGSRDQQCRGCFDGAWDEGQRYRRGPVLRPFYYHQRPCYLVGTCATPLVDCTPYGCYGDEFVDPAWGGRAARRRPSNAHQDVYYEDEVEESEELVVDEPAVVNGTNTNGTDDGWKVEAVKCHVVSENVTTITNCTENGLDDNEFATEPEVNFADELSEQDLDEFDRESRYRRQAQHLRSARYIARSRRPSFEIEDSYEDEDIEVDTPPRRRDVASRIANEFDEEYDAELEAPVNKRPSQKQRQRQRRLRREKNRARKARRERERKNRAKRAKKHRKAAAAKEPDSSE